MRTKPATFVHLIVLPSLTTMSFQSNTRRALQRSKSLHSAGAWVEHINPETQASHRASRVNEETHPAIDAILHPCLHPYLHPYPTDQKISCFSPLTPNDQPAPPTSPLALVQTNLDCKVPVAPSRPKFRRCLLVQIDPTRVENFRTHICIHSGISCAQKPKPLRASITNQ